MNRDALAVLKRLQSSDKNTLELCASDLNIDCAWFIKILDAIG